MNKGFTPALIFQKFRFIRAQCAEELVRGFTLIETLVATLIFTTIVVVVVNLFVSAMSSQEHVLSNQRVVDDVSLVLETMSRITREAQRDDAGTCIATGKNFEEVTVSGALQFIDGNGSCRNLIFDSAANRIAEQVSPDGDQGNLSSSRHITSGDFEVHNFDFFLQGEQGPPDTAQPLVTLLIEAGPKGSTAPSIYMQTTISQRNLDN